MCRLFAYVSPASSTIDHELGEDGIESFLALARLHGDGWGWAGIGRPGEAPEVRKSPQSAAVDPDFRSAVDSAGHAAMIHLRWATSGLPVEMRNAHPFRHGKTSFEHNGSLKPIGRLREMLTPDVVAELTGDTDSEMYFALIRAQQKAGATLPDATLHVARRLRDAFPFASLNAILLDSEQMVVVHASAHSALADDDVAEIAQLGGLPDEHNEDYFALRWKHGADGTVLISSTGVAGDGWESLPAESVTTVRLDDRTAHSATLAVPVGDDTLIA